jgi:hypothetical protein
MEKKLTKDKTLLATKANNHFKVLILPRHYVNSVHENPTISFIRGTTHLRFIQRDSACSQQQIHPKYNSSL